MNRNSKKTNYKAKRFKQSSSRAKGSTSSYDNDDKCSKKFDDRITKSTSFNDPAWYGMDQSLLRDSASVPFVYPMGAPVSTGMALKSQVTVPGICAMELCPTTGFSVEPNSPINIAANSLYTFVRHANSGSRNYDSPNLMMYILAAADVFSYINFLQRVYGVAMLYNQMNRYIPEGLLKAMHVDAKSVRDNLANFRYGINVLINKASSLAVPANIPLFRRKAFIYSNIYKEGMSLKDQLYMFVPAGFYQYADPANLNFVPFVPGQLIIHTAQGSTVSDFNVADHTEFTYSDLLNYGMDLLSTLFGSEDMGIMNGDILKAYGSEGILKLQELPENYSIDFVFDIAVLEQMKNAYAVELTYASSNTDAPNIIFRRDSFTKVNTKVTYNLPFFESNKSVIFGPYIVSRPCVRNNDIDSGNKWITTQSEVVTPDLVMENSRLIPSITTSSELKSGFLAVNAMTEVLVDTHYYQMNVDNTDLESTHFHVAYITYDKTVDRIPSATDLCRVNAFRFHPFMYMIQQTNTSPVTYDVQLYSNIDNYTICDNDVIFRLNQTALMSLLNVPSVAKAY